MMNTRLIGKFITDFRKLDEFQEPRYEALLAVKRWSGVEDMIPVVMSYIPNDNCSGKRVEVLGDFKSVRYGGSDGKKHVKMFIRPEEILLNTIEPEDYNLSKMSGYIVHEPTYRETPLGKKITELIISVHYGDKSSYLNCIAWDEKAQKAKTLHIGDRIHFIGRIQSRNYLKVMETGESKTMTAREFSIADYKLITS